MGRREDGELTGILFKRGRCQSHLVGLSIVTDMLKSRIWERDQERSLGKIVQNDHFPFPKQTL